MNVMRSNQMWQKIKKGFKILWGCLVLYLMTMVVVNIKNNNFEEALITALGASVAFSLLEEDY